MLEPKHLTVSRYALSGGCSMQIKKIDYILAIAEEGSISRAA